MYISVCHIVLNNRIQLFSLKVKNRAMMTDTHTRLAKDLQTTGD
jgi:hypothetical protein